MLQSCFPLMSTLIPFLVGFLPADDKKDKSPDLVRIGIMASFYRDQPEEIVKTTVESLKELMLAQTGFQGEPIKVENYDRLGEDLVKNRKQLGVFYGHEFAWAWKKYPKLKPLVIVVNQEQHQRAYLMVAKDNKAAGLANLKGKSVAIALHTPEPCHLYLARTCQALGTSPKDFFSKINHPANVEIALDDVVDGSTEATLVEEVALQSYQRRKPGRFAKLREMQRSEVFPAAVVAYQPEHWDQADLKIIQDSLLQAQQHPEGRQLLILWKLTNFEQVPENYEQSLAKILKAYPPPDKK